MTQYSSVAGSALGASMQVAPSQTSHNSQTTSQGYDILSLPRRQHYHNIRNIMAEMLVTLDEKTHVINTATEALDRQLARCESSWPAIQEEISEEARWGNLHHWAYNEKIGEKKAIAHERPRREVAHHHNFVAGAMAGDAEIARQDLTRRKRHQQAVDSDFDDLRSKKVPTLNKTKKAVEAAVTENANNTHKRRRVEKPTVGGLPVAPALQRSASSLLAVHATNARAGSPAAEGGRKKGRVLPVPNPNAVTGRRR